MAEVLTSIETSDETLRGDFLGDSPHPYPNFLLRWGNWIIVIRGDEMRIENAESKGISYRLWRDSNGWVDVEMRKVIKTIYPSEGIKNEE